MRNVGLALIDGQSSACSRPQVPPPRDKRITRRISETTFFQEVKKRQKGKRYPLHVKNKKIITRRQTRHRSLFGGTVLEIPSHGLCRQPLLSLLLKAKNNYVALLGNLANIDGSIDGNNTNTITKLHQYLLTEYYFIIFFSIYRQKIYVGNY